jgi:hypothetical protein
MNNLIKFVSNKAGLTGESASVPSPIIKTIPEWYRKADRFAKKLDGTFWKGPDNGKVPTWKACPAIFDIMGTGYTLKTPCDIEFIEKDSKTLIVTISDARYKEFCTPRQKMPQFEHPEGYHHGHFAWFPDWGVETPEGYSVLYSQPFNRFELPFLTTSGIIDNDTVNLLGSMPFFIRKGFSGVVPAGTPFVQLIPFKREDWSSEVIIEDENIMYEKNRTNSMKYRVPDGGVYKNKVWKPRRYE